MKILILSRLWFYLTNWQFHHQCVIGYPHWYWFCILGTLLVVQNLDIWTFVILECQCIIFTVTGCFDDIGCYNIWSLWWQQPSFVSLPLSSQLYLLMVNIISAKAFLLSLIFYVPHKQTVFEFAIVCMILLFIS